jgi:hypothetical protein
VKYLIQALLVATLCACGGPGETGGSSSLSSTSASPQATAATSSLNDSPDTARARAEIIADIQAHRRESVAKFGEQGAFVLALDSLIAKLRTTPAKSSEELEELVGEEMLDLLESETASDLSAIKSSIPARIHPEPQAREKREAVGLGGLCSNDLVVDMGNFRVQSLEFVSKLLKLARHGQDPRSLEASQAANALVDRCDLLVDRYGATAVCRVKADGSEEYDLASFRTGCQRLREGYRELL